MAELTTLARPYAKAAFEYALANKELAVWSKMLQLLATIASHQAVQNALKNPSLTSKQQAEILINVCGDQIDDYLANFLKTLAENKRLMLLTEVARIFEVLKAEVEKTLDVQVTSAFALDSVAKENLVKSLERKLNCEVKVQSTIDNTLIGGIIIRAGDMIIDGSIKGRLTKLAEAMNS